MSILSKYSPLKISSSELQPNILLMCKMLITLLLLHGFFLEIKDPYLPYIKWFDIFNSYPGFFKYSLRIGFIIFGLMLFFNFKTKWSSLTLGIIVILTLLSSKPLFRNHIFIAGCILFLVGLSDPKGIPWLIIIQISIVYFGASLNKILQIDWWTGQFMDNWLGVARDNAIYNFMSSLLPNLWLAKFMSWSAIIVEFVIAVSILIKKWRSFGIWLLIVFHFAMFTMLAFRFGHFVQDIFIILIAFLNWPKQKIEIKFNNKFILLKKIIGFMDWDKLYIWHEGTKDGNNVFESKNSESKSLSFISLLMYCEGFYVFLLFFDYLMMKLVYSAEPYFMKILIHSFFSILIWGLILLFILDSIKTKRSLSVIELEKNNKRREIRENK